MTCRRPPGLWLALLVCLLSCAHADSASAGERPASASPPDAEITLSSGPGHIDGRFVLRGEELTLLAPFAEDGGPVGLFAVRLPTQDPLFAALAGVPTSVAGAPPAPGMPTVAFALRGKDGKGSQRRLVVARPVADPRVDKALRELDRCERLARHRALMAFSLAISPGDRERTWVATVSVQGEPSAQAVLSTGALAVQAVPDPGPPQPGVTPLPPEWETVSTLASPVHSETLKPGGSLQVRLMVEGSESEPRHLRGVFEGSVELRVRGLSENVRMSFSSKATALPGTRAKNAKK